MIPPPTVDQLKAQAAAVRSYFAMTLTRPAKHELSEPGRKLLEMVEALPPNMFFSHASLAGELVVSRALVERAFEVLNAGPGSAGIGKALMLLREALGDA